MTTSNRKKTDKKTTKRQLFDKPQQVVVTGSKKSVISDPLVSINDRLDKLSEYTALAKDTRHKIDELKATFKDDLLSFLDDSDDRPMITHTNDKNKKVYLQIKKTYKYDEKLTLKEEKIKNLLEDLKSEQKKAVRYGKAELIKEDVSIIFRD